MGIDNIDVSTLTVGSTSIGLSSASPTLAAVIALGAKTARIVPIDGDIYWRDDGSDCTSTAEKCYQDDAIVIAGARGERAMKILSNIRFLRVSGDVKVIIHWYN